MLGCVVFLIQILVFCSYDSVVEDCNNLINTSQNALDTESLTFVRKGVLAL